MLRTLAICLGCCLVVALQLLVSCHDAPRENPFDPELTPAVELTVEQDVTKGTAILTWERYAGEARFAAYWVLRNAAKSTEVDTLARISEVGQTTFEDSSLVPDTAFDYRVSVVNTGGLGISSSVKSIPSYSLSPVQLLAVETNPLEGILVVRWQRYRGANFQGYQVSRRISNSIEEEVLEELIGVGDTVFVDRDVRADIGYVYKVAVRAAGQRLESASLEGRLELPGVQIEESEFDSPSGSAILAWSRYVGPRFAAYRVERRTAVLAPQVVARIAASDTVSFMDGGLVGNTRYFYRVVVETQAGEEVASEEMDGIFHPWVKSWPLAVEEEGYVRLYPEPDGQIVALVAEPKGVRLLIFDSEGNLLSDWFPPEFVVQDLEPRSVAMARTPDGRRFLCLGDDKAVGLVAFTSDGRFIKRERPLFAEVLEPLSGHETQVQGWVSLLARSVEKGWVGYDNPEVSSRDSVLFSHDFESAVEREDGANPWIWNPYGIRYEDGWIWRTTGSTSWTAVNIHSGSSVNTLWQELRIEVDMVLKGAVEG